MKNSSSTNAMKTIFIGNPGTGKSTLLNGLLGEPLFKSGFSCGAGMTTVLQWVKTSNGDSYADTPGLQDVDIRKQAAEEITKALKSGDGHYKLVFVVTQEDGRVRPADLTTMNTVLDALQQTETKIPYAIIVNKIYRRALEKLNDPVNRCKFISALVGKYSTVDIHFYEEVDSLRSMDNVVHEATDGLRTFLSDLPSIYIKESLVFDVDTEDFDEKIEEMEKQMSDLLNDKAAQAKKMEEFEKLAEDRDEKLRRDHEEQLKKHEEKSEEEAKKNAQVISGLEKKMEESDKRSQANLEMVVRVQKEYEKKREEKSEEEKQRMQKDHYEQMNRMQMQRSSPCSIS